MKKLIPAMIAAFMLVCLFVGLAPTLLKTAGLTRARWNSLVGREGFYFQKRQWLADLRTIMAAIRFLYASQPGKPNQSLDMAGLPESSPRQVGISTNLLGTNGTASSQPAAGKRFSMVGRFTGRRESAVFEQQAPVLTLEDYSPQSLPGRRLVWV